MCFFKLTSYLMVAFKHLLRKLQLLDVNKDRLFKTTLAKGYKKE